MNFFGMEEPLANQNNLNQLLAHLEQLNQFNPNVFNVGAEDVEGGNDVPPVNGPQLQYELDDMEGFVDSDDDYPHQLPGQQIE